MKSMKEYVDEIMNEIFNLPSEMRNEPDYKDCIEMVRCPFCQCEDLVIYFKETKYGHKAYHSCPNCEKAWLIEFDHINETIETKEIDWSVNLPEIPE